MRKAFHVTRAVEFSWACLVQTVLGDVHAKPFRRHSFFFAGTDLVYVCLSTLI